MDAQRFTSLLPTSMDPSHEVRSTRSLHHLGITRQPQGQSPANNHQSLPALPPLPARHTSLPTIVLSSSRLPEQSSNSLLTFGGTSTEDVTMFMENVRMTAFMQGREGDDRWEAFLASTCLTGSAMRWFTLQPPDVQCSWNRLSDAMIRAFPSNNASASTSISRPNSARPSSFATTSANSSPRPSSRRLTPRSSFTGHTPPPPPLPPLPPFPSLTWPPLPNFQPPPTFSRSTSTFSSPPAYSATALRSSRSAPSLKVAAMIPKLPTRKGRIRIVMPNGAFAGYLPQTITGTAKYPGGLPQTTSEALVAAVPFRGFLDDFEWKVLIHRAPEGKRLRLGLTRLGDRTLKQWCLAACGVGPDVYTYGEKVPSHEVWSLNINPMDGAEELCASWSRKNKLTPLYFAFHAHKRGAIRIWLTPMEVPDYQLRLIFEPL
ncbi:hypothetical protein FRB94_012860 [Tulasnella sp. JGI-2019a]|nr:hypothetical protein FRB94_012860 [Tulasnella sp. JGI-2019a]